MMETINSITTHVAHAQRMQQWFGTCLGQYLLEQEHQYFDHTVVNAVSNQTTDIFVVRLNTNGDLVWARSFGGTWWENAFGICGNSAGDVFISGYFESASFEVGKYHLTNKGESDIYVIMIDPAGQIVWVKSFGNTGAETSYAVATNATGNCYLTGSFDSPSLGFGTFTLINSGIAMFFS